MKAGKWIAKFVVMAALAVVVFGFVTQYLWNWLVPTLFNGPTITFIQALGLWALSKILFWGMGGGGGYRGPRWNHQWKARYSNMSPEQKERLKQRFKEKWCEWEETPAKSDAETASETKTI